MKKLFLSVVVLFVLASLSFSQIKSSDYFSTKIIRKDKDFAFPLFWQSNNIGVENRINRFLQLSELSQLVRHTSNIFKQTSIDDGTIYGGKTSLISTIYSNNRSVLSIGFDESSCGMTCAYWHRYHNFNPGNGDRIELKDLFNKKNYGKFRKLVFTKRAKAYRKDVLRNVPIKDRQYMMDQSGLLEDDDLSDFYILKDSIAIDGENFLSKNNKFFGLNMYVKFYLSEFKPLLNDYGKAVFGLSVVPLELYHSASLPQLFEGRVNDKWPFVMVMDTDGVTEASGIYAYLRYGVGIDLQGTVSDSGELIFSERILTKARPEIQWLHEGTYEDNGTIQSRLQGSRLIGTWTSRDKTTTLPFVAQR